MKQRYWQAKDLSLFNLIVQGDFAIIISWVTDKERGSWKFENWMFKIIDTSNELGCSFSWIPCLANKFAYQLAKQGAKHMVSFVGDFFPLWVSNVFSPIYICSFYEDELGFCGSCSWLLYTYTNFCTTLKDAYPSCLYQLIDEWKCLFLIKNKSSKYAYQVNIVPRKM